MGGRRVLPMQSPHLTPALVVLSTQSPHVTPALVVLPTQSPHVTPALVVLPTQSPHGIDEERSYSRKQWEHSNDGDSSQRSTTRRSILKMPHVELNRIGFNAMKAGIMTPPRMQEDIAEHN